jgi:predicted permease
VTIGELFGLILPVFALIAVGVALRRFHWIEGAAETSLIRLVVYVCMPCLVFDTVVGNASLRDPANLLFPPLAGFVTTAVGFGVAYLGALAFGLRPADRLRTFALTAGVCNYRYLAFPIIGAFWGAPGQGLMFVENIGVELAFWSVGLVVLTGVSPLSDWRRLLSPMLLTLVASVAVNLLGLAPHVPSLVSGVTHALGACAVTIGIVMTGVSIVDQMGRPSSLLDWRVAIAACVVRVGILPLVMLCVVRWVPFTIGLRQVLVVEGAMPAGVISILVARHYGGNALTSVQVVLWTTALGLITCPLWIRLGLACLGTN